MSAASICGGSISRPTVITRHYRGQTADPTTDRTGDDLSNFWPPLLKTYYEIIAFALSRRRAARRAKHEVLARAAGQELHVLTGSAPTSAASRAPSRRRRPCRPNQS